MFLDNNLNWNHPHCDLQCAILYNEKNHQFNLTDIKARLAVWEGQNDGDDWRWVLELKDGKFAFVQGGCDYTGCDCQSWCLSRITDTPESAARYALGDFEIDISK